MRKSSEFKYYFLKTGNKTQILSEEPTIPKGEKNSPTAHRLTGGVDATLAYSPEGFVDSAARTHRGD